MNSEIRGMNKMNEEERKIYWDYILGLARLDPVIVEPVRDICWEELHDEDEPDDEPYGSEDFWGDVFPGGGDAGKK